MDRLAQPSAPFAGAGTHIKKLGDCFGQFLVRVSCVCGASRHIEPEALARLVGWSTTLSAAALLAVREEGEDPVPPPRGGDAFAETRHMFGRALRRLAPVRPLGRRSLGTSGL